MTPDKFPSNKDLTESLTASKEKETYRQLEKTNIYRVGVGARKELPDAPIFFFEVLLTLSTNRSDVDLLHLEKTIHILKALRERQYVLTYLDGTNSISCELVLPFGKLAEEYVSIKTLVSIYFES
jgi:hypothetical protein